MNDTIWYYVDRAQQRHGPVTGAAVADAWRAGDADDNSLVWREGLPEWLPLARFHDELGLAGAPAPAEARQAAPADPSPVRTAGAVAAAVPAKSGNGCLIAAIIGGLVLVMVLAILAAIALPAYQQYVDRAREAATEIEIEPDAGLDAAVDPGPATGELWIVAAALGEARQYQPQVDDFVANTDRCPRDASEIALAPVVTPGVAAITVGEARTGMCTIEVEFGGDGAETLYGERLTLSRDVAGDWYCTSAMADRDSLPADCR